jgi:hypothetical protein
MSDLIGPMKGGRRTVASDGLINENVSEAYGHGSTVLYEGKQWTVSGFEPFKRIYTLRNDELFVKVSEAVLRKTN